MYELDDTYLYYLRMMGDSRRKHILSTCSNHPTERTFGEGVKHVYVLTLIQEGYLSGEVVVGAYGRNYTDITLTEKGKLQLDMLDL
ncbi:hypothetical protein EHLJMEHL_02213 [Vreelandella titanicae]